MKKLHKSSFLKFYNVKISFNNNVVSDNKKGLLYGLIGVIFVGLQPIIAISNPPAVNAYISAAMTCLVETTIFFPLMIVELIRNKKNNINQNFSNNSILKGWRNNLWLLIFIGFIFGINQIFFFVGYKMAGPVNGSLTQKTTVFFAMLLGYLILKEKITKLQIFFSIILFFGLMIGITQGFSLIEFSLTILFGVIILLAISFLWMVGHTLTKPILDRKEATPIQMVFIRNFLSGTFLIITYFIFFPIDFSIFFDLDNAVFFLSMGTVYGSGLVCWYKTLSYLEVSKASTIFAPTPVLSAIFTIIFLDESLRIYNLIGIILVILSIIVIINQKRE
ncbi:MAG: DMT family transporter [Promethearchaeota archaeon]